MPTLAEYVASKHTDNTVRAWFESHDDVRREVQTVCREDPNVNATHIGAWLRAEHEFPFSRAALGAWLRACTLIARGAGKR